MGGSTGTGGASGTGGSTGAGGATGMAGAAGTSAGAGTSGNARAGTSGSAGTSGNAGTSGSAGAGGTTPAGSAGTTGAAGSGGRGARPAARARPALRAQAAAADDRQPRDTTGGAGATGGAAAVTLDQTGNPINSMVTTYLSWLSTAAGDAAKLTADKVLADNMITWQMPHGGFFKHDKAVYAAPWNGTAARSDWRGANNVELGTIDNNGTVTQAMFLADVYRRSSEAKYRDAARRAMDFLLTMQARQAVSRRSTPARAASSYSNYITFNDDAMVRVLTMLDWRRRRRRPRRRHLHARTS